MTKDLPHMEWTGERYVPEIRGDIELEHVHRYAFARQFSRDKVVLDIASGEGYGTAILAEVAHKVIGVDISMEAIIHASNRYFRENVEFRRGSCTEIPLSESSVDVVVSFETIEHHNEHVTMMAELKRVLKPKGILIISSPEKHEYSDLPGYNNQYHVRELYRQEFEELISMHFKYFGIFGQKILYGSGILRENGESRLMSYRVDQGCNKEY